MKHKSNGKTIKVREKVMVKGKGKQRGAWKIGRIDILFVGKDSVISEMYESRHLKGF